MTTTNQTPACPTHNKPLRAYGAAFVCDHLTQAGVDRDGDPTFVQCQHVQPRVEFEVVEFRLPALQAKFAMLAKRAAKLGCQAPSLIVAETYEKKFERFDEMRDKKETRFATVCRCVVTGAVVSLNGWTFVAALDHDGEENIIRAAHGDKVPAEYRTSRPTCDHCKTNRRRVETFVLRHDDGRHVQIGRQCLKDFLGHSDPISAAAMAELLWDAVATCSASEDDEEGGFGHGNASIESYLQWVAAACRIVGWVSKKKADDTLATATATTASAWMDGYKRPLRTVDEEKADSDKAAAALAWARALPDDLDDDYLANVRAAAKRYSVKPKAMGIVASILPAYDRDLTKKAMAATNVPAPEGKMMVRGTIISCKAADGDWGTTFKMTVKVVVGDGQWLAWGTCPDSLLEYGRAVKPGFAADALRGCDVEFNATLTRGREEHFAIFKRPTKARVVHDPSAKSDEAKAA